MTQASAEALRSEVERKLRTRADPDGLYRAPGGIGLFRAFAPSGINHAIYRPVICLVLAGAKTVTVGRETVEFTAGHSALIGNHCPVASRITRATRTEPYLAFAIDLDLPVFREFLARTGTPPNPQHLAPSVLLHETDTAVADCALRLTRLLDRPEAAPILRPGIISELHYWLLSGRHGDTIRSLAHPDGHAERLSRAIAILYAEFRRPIPIARLAREAGMSPSSFHAHFKAATSLSPGQFCKQLRLIEARRLMHHDGANPSRAAIAVGYESVTQFTREYGRMFGAPPRRDTLSAAA